MYVYYFSQLLQENLVELDHGLAPHNEVEEEDYSITEPGTADNMKKTENDMVSETFADELVNSCLMTPLFLYMGISVSCNYRPLILQQDESIMCNKNK